MLENWTQTAAFAYFGAVATNIQWSWSARSPDLKTVVLTWWMHEIVRDGPKLIYDMRDHSLLNEWRGRHGNRDRIKNLTCARDHCNRLFRVVWCEAREPNARIPKAVRRWPDKDLWMRLTELNETTGEFRAESVGG